MAIPTTQKVPLFWAQMNYDGASAPTTSGPTLLMGTLLSGGTGSANSPSQVFSAAEVAGLFGRGSQIHRVAIAYFANDRTAGEVWAIALAESTTAAGGTVTFTGTATEAGAIYLEIGGVVLNIPVAVGDTHLVVGAALDLALPAHGVTPNDYQVSGVDTAGAVVMTAKYKGETGNGISLNLNPLGTAGRQTVPAGLTAAITDPMGDTTEGAGNPVLTTAIAAVAGMDFDFIFEPWTDTVSRAALKTMMSDANGRWSYQQAEFGHVWSSRFGTPAELLDVEPNDQHYLMLGLEGVNSTGVSMIASVPNLVEEVGAAYMGRCAESLRNDPAQPCQTLELLDDVTGLIAFRAPDKADRMTMEERNTLLSDGVATASYTSQSGILVERAMTSYTEDSFGNGTELDVQPLYISMFVLRTWKAAVETDFGRSKILENTTNEIAALLVAKYDEMAELGLVTDVEGFAASLSVTVNSVDQNRIDVAAAPVYAAQLRIVALQNNFKL